MSRVFDGRATAVVLVLPELVPSAMSSAAPECTSKGRLVLRRLCLSPIFIGNAVSAYAVLPVPSGADTGEGAGTVAGQSMESFLQVVMRHSWRDRYWIARQTSCLCTYLDVTPSMCCYVKCNTHGNISHCRLWVAEARAHRFVALSVVNDAELEDAMTEATKYYNNITSRGLQPAVCCCVRH